MTVSSVLYIITGNAKYAVMSHSIFFNHMMLELVYGYLYFPKYMYFLTTYVHHVVYFFSNII